MDWQKDLYNNALKSHENVFNFLKSLDDSVFQEWMFVLNDIFNDIRNISEEINLEICAFSVDYINYFRNLFNFLKGWEVTVNSLYNDLRHFYERLIKPIEIKSIDEIDFMSTKYDYVEKILKPNRPKLMHENQLTEILINFQTNLQHNFRKITEAKIKVQEAMETFSSLNLRKSIDSIEKTIKNSGQQATLGELTQKLELLNNILSEKKDVQPNSVQIAQAKKEYINAVLALHNGIKLLPDILLDNLSEPSNRLWSNPIRVYNAVELKAIEYNVKLMIRSCNIFKAYLAKTIKKNDLPDPINWIDATKNLLIENLAILDIINIKLIDLCAPNGITIQRLTILFRENPWTSEERIESFCTLLNDFINLFMNFKRVMPDRFLNNGINIRTELFDQIKDKARKLTKTQADNLDNIIKSAETQINDRGIRIADLVTKLNAQLKPIVDESKDILQDLMNMQYTFQCKIKIENDLERRPDVMRKEILRNKFENQLNESMNSISKRLNDIIKNMKQKLSDPQNNDSQTLEQFVERSVNNLDSYIKDVHNAQINMINDICQEFPDNKDKSSDRGFFKRFLCKN